MYHKLNMYISFKYASFSFKIQFLFIFFNKFNIKLYKYTHTCDKQKNMYNAPYTEIHVI